MALQGGVKAAIALSLVSLFFLVAGFVLPWWFVFGDSVYMGVWYFLSCPSGISATNCTVHVFSSVVNYDSDAGNIEGKVFFTVFQVITSVSTGFCFFSCLILIICACGGARSKGGYVISCIFLLFSSLSSLVVCGFFIYLFVAIYLDGSTFTVNGKNFPYALLSFGLGCIFVFIAFLTLAISLCMWRNYDSDDDDNSEDGQRYPMSGMDKRGTYPSGYDNPRYPSDPYNYSDSRKPYPTQPGYGSKNPQHYDNRNYGRSDRDYSYRENNGYPYKQENMYRPYSRKY